MIDELDTATPVAGPFSGRLVEATTGVVPVAPAGVAVSDFATSATFVNPTRLGRCGISASNSAKTKQSGIASSSSSG